MKFENFNNTKENKKKEGVGQLGVFEQQETKQSLSGILKAAFEKIKGKCAPLMQPESDQEKIDSSIGLDNNETEEIRKELAPKFLEIKQRASTLENIAEEKFGLVSSSEDSVGETGSLEKLRVRMQYEKDEREKNERWAEQRFKTLNVQDKVTEGATPEEIEEAIKQNIPEFSPQRKRMERVSEKYKKSSEAVKKHLDKYSSTEESFEALCGFKANGKVEMRHGASDITFVVEDENDFSRVVRGKESLSERELIEISWIGGAVATNKDVPEEFRGAGLIVLSRDGMEKTREQLGDIETHERQHVTNGLYDGEKRGALKYVSIEEIKKAPENEKREKILSYFLYKRQYADNNKMSDELLAHYKGLDFANEDEVHKKITANLVISYREKFYGPTVEAERRVLERLGIEKSLVEECVAEIFRDDSWRTTRDALEGLRKLERSGFSKDQAINLVQLEPLSEWGNVADKLIEHKDKKPA